MIKEGFTLTKWNINDNELTWEYVGETGFTLTKWNINDERCHDRNDVRTRFTLTKWNINVDIAFVKSKTRVVLH